MKRIFAILLILLLLGACSGQTPEAELSTEPTTSVEPTLTSEPETSIEPATTSRPATSSEPVTTPRATTSSKPTTSIKPTQPQTLKCESPFEGGGVIIISNGVEHRPYAQLVHAMEYDSEGNQILGISIDFARVKELLEVLPVIKYADDFRIIFEGDDNADYTLYDEKGEHLFPDVENNYYPYLRMSELSFPEKPGTYILVIGKSYRQGNSGSAYQYAAKIIK